MEKNPEHSEFMKTVNEIKVAEDEYEHLVSEAKEKADAILRKAKEQIIKEQSKAKENSVSYKNERLKEGSEEIEQEVNQILKKANVKAASIRKSRTDQGFILSLVKSLLSK